MSPRSSRIRWNNPPPSNTSGDQISPVTPSPAVESPSTPLLDQIGRDLTQLAREGRLKPLFGQQKELRQLQRILLRKQKITHFWLALQLLEKLLWWRDLPP